MKIRTIQYILKEGIFNTYRNKLMFLASVSIVTASLIIFGISLLVTINLNNNMKFLKDQPEIEVFCFPDLGDDQIKQVEDSLKSNTKIEEYKTVTKQEAFEKVKKMLGENENLLEGEDESFLPVSYIIKLKNPIDSESVVAQLKNTNGVEKVAYSHAAVEFISKITYWIRLISVLLVVVLLVISIFIIANTIKLTVFARRKEISIMKYIGATDWFIRWPFIIEGIIIGLVGSAIAFVLISYGYSSIESRFNNDLLQASLSFFKFVKINEIGMQIIGLYALLGVIIGAMGSIVSIRKYLHV